MKNRTWIFLLLGWMGICMYLVYVIYADIRQKTIDEYNQRQMIHAEQAKQGIENFFVHWITYLSSFSDNEHIVALDEKGKDEIEFIYKINRPEVSAVTRLDAGGTIIHTIPFDKELIGKNISNQKHIREILQKQKFVVSDVFRTLQGYDAIALHIPVFQGKYFYGTLGVLINVGIISKEFLENIHLGKTGYAWMTSRDGIELHCPIPGHVGNSVYENCKNFPSIIRMADRMLKGEKGITSYEYDQIRDQKTITIKKHAVFLPIRVGNAFWSIVVASSEDDVLSGIENFGEKLSAVIGLLFLGCFICLYFGMRVQNFLRLAEERRKSENRFHSLFYAMLEGLALHKIIYNSKGEAIDYIILDVNPAFESHTGISRKTVVGGKASEVYGSETPPYLDIYAQVAATKKPANFEVYFEPLQKHFNISVFSTEKEHFATVFENITGRKQAEKAIRKLNEELEDRVRIRTAQLEAANKELESFSYSVSHDLRAPLRGIDGWSQALAEDCGDQLDEQGKIYLDRIREEARRMSNLIEDMLKLSRLTRSEIKISSVNLSELARTIADSLQEADTNRKVEVMIFPDLIADADEGMMSIVLTNLLGNAWKFTGKIPNPIIQFGRLESEDSRIRTEDAGRQVFFVKDNGAGFDMKYAGKLFGTFQRMHKSREFPGTGIGLATVQRIIHRHGGRIWAEAWVNQGATFYFTL
jgi:signal transduction histidine kinase